MDPLSISSGALAQLERVHELKRTVQECQVGLKEQREQFSLLIQELDLVALVLFTHLADSRRWDLSQTHSYAEVILPSFDALQKILEFLQDSVALLPRNARMRRLRWDRRDLRITEQHHHLGQVRKMLSFQLQLVSMDSMKANSKLQL